MRPWSTNGRLSRGLTLRRLLTQGPAVQLLLKTMNARIAAHAGTPQLKQFLMVNIKTKFPRGIAGVTAITKCSIGHLNGLSFGSTPPVLDQVISKSPRDGVVERAPGPGLNVKRQASSAKLR